MVLVQFCLLVESGPRAMRIWVPERYIQVGSRVLSSNLSLRYEPEDREQFDELTHSMFEEDLTCDWTVVRIRLSSDDT